MALTISNLTVKIKGKLILDDVSIEVRTGEFFSLLGSSGCGKSTLLKTVAGLMQEESGQILLDDKKLHCLPPQKRGTVIMFQDGRLFSNMDVAENVTFALRNKGVKKLERAKTAEKYLDMVQLSGFGSRRIQELSGGQQQRVALARALAAEPSLLMLDEPFSALDENLRDDMRLLVKRIHEETGLTTIMVTHDQREALGLSDRIAVMDAGKVVQVGTPAEVYEKPADILIASYFADGDVLVGEVENGTFTCGALSFASDKPDGPCTAVVRQAALAVGKEGQAGVPFMIDSVQYEGNALSAVLVARDVTLHYDFAVDAGIQAGQVVSVAVDPASVMFF